MEEPNRFKIAMTVVGCGQEPLALSLVLLLKVPTPSEEVWVKGVSGGEVKYHPAPQHNSFEGILSQSLIYEFQSLQVP